MTLRLATTMAALKWFVSETGALADGPANRQQLERPHDATLERAIRSLGPDHPITLGVELFSMTQRMLNQDDCGTLTAEFEETLTRARQRLGARHPTTLGLSANLSFIGSITGDADKSRILADETLRFARIKPGSNHFVSLHASACSPSSTPNTVTPNKRASSERRPWIVVAGNSATTT